MATNQAGTSEDAGIAPRKQPPDLSRQRVIDEARRIEEDGTYSSKSQYNSAATWQRVHITLGVLSAVASGISAFSAVMEYPAHIWVAAGSAAVAGALTATSTLLNPSEKAAAHQQFGASYTALRDDARRLATIHSGSDPINKIRDSLEHLARRKSDLNHKAPQPLHSAFLQARKDIADKQAEYEVDKREA